MADPRRGDGGFRVRALPRPEGLYASNYSDAQLRGRAERIRAWGAQRLDLYAYFNNDPNAHAVRNALRLRELVG